MATMVKEKSKDKKKSKDKHKLKKVVLQEVQIEEEEPSISNETIPNEILPQTQTVTETTHFPDKCNVNEENKHVETELPLTANTTIPINEDVEFVENHSDREIDKTNEIVLPSAPIFVENLSIPTTYLNTDKVQAETKIKVPCMPLDEAIRLFGGKEIAEVLAISEKEEAIVEAGPQSKPDHPLIDLLSTFRTSLIAVDRERNRLSCKYAEEDKSRDTIWKVEKRTLNLTEKCACGTNVSLKASFDIAKLDRDRLSAARLRLEALLQDVQDSYCHHQHAALQTHCDIDEVVNETIQKPNEYIREALALMFEALRFSDAAPVAYAQALQRWASVLSSALLEEHNFHHLLFVLHNLFRQTRSVQWAGHVLSVRAPDMCSAARLVGVLELLLTRPVLESAHECTEDSEAWEELDVTGEGCAVGEGRLRERDLLALLRALPLRDLLARLALFGRQDLSEQTEQWWGDASGGHGVLKASCGVRAALHVCVRARRSHAGYARLLAQLRALAVAALRALAALHVASRSSYVQDLAQKIPAELEACFAAGFTLLGEEAYELPAELLSDDVAEEYCNTLISGLHDKSVHIASLSVEVEAQSCGLRTRIVTQAALSRPEDQDLARIVLDFLFQTGINRKPACKGLCDVTARELLPKLLAVHPHVHTLAFHMLGDYNQVEADSSLLEPLSLQHWRPTSAEIVGVLDDWAVRCPQLLQHLLLNLDYTPNTGVALDSQVSAGRWVCEWAARRGGAPEWAWRALRALRVHRSQWRGAGGAPASSAAPPSALHAALALLAADWGHSVPLVCGPGADALLQLAQTRPLDALHCAGFVMRVMAQSPESISLTPKFTEIFATILNFGPSLVQRALGQRADSGADLLQKLVLEQLQDPDIHESSERSALLRAWLHALWVPALPAAARALLDRALRRTRDWRALDAHVEAALQEARGAELVADGARHAGAAPLLCECALRHAHARELATHMYARLLDQLACQRAASQKIHVDNALKQIGSSMCEDELSIHRCACAVLSVRMQHPAHLLLWRLLLHMWLHRRSESTPPVGPLFFSGIVKSRTLVQLKKRLQETAVYHRNQVDSLKASDSGTSSATAPTRVKKKTPPLDNNLFQTLSIINDLTGEPESEQDSTVSEEDGKTETKSESETKTGYDLSHIIGYHAAAEKMVREYLTWLEEGENVRAYPHHADIGRYISEQALDAAWRASLADAPPAPPALPAPPRPPRASAPPRTPYERALAAVSSVDDGSRARHNIRTSHISISDSVLKDPFLLIELLEKYIEELKKLNEQWQSDCFRVALLDSQLWDLVEGLRVRRPLPPARATCPHDCKPIVVHIPEDEWCISTGVEQAIHENRRSARAAVRRLTRARPHAARVTSLLHSLGSRVCSAAAGARAAELAWGAAPRAEAYPPARDALAALVAAVAQRWLNHDSVLTSELLTRWSAGSGLQQQLCGVLVTPARMPPGHWPRLYGTVLALPLPPHAIFSYLSKFDITHWADVTDTSSRSEVLESIVKAATRIGPEPTQEDLVLVEILGVHSAAVVRERELCEHVLRCARACAASELPPPYCAHLPGLAGRARDLHLEQIGRLLHDLGLIWWEARSSTRSNSALYAEYAPHFANTLHSLLKEFVAAAVRCTYTPERVAHCSWPVLQTSWCPWVAPHNPLSQSDHQSEVLECFVDTIRMVMDDCPGSAEAMLRHTWEWAAQCALSEPRPSCALLAQLAYLPWHLQWLRADCVPLALQICGIADEEVRGWFGQFVRHASAECWLRGVSDEQASAALAALLALFTAARPLVPPETLEGACQLPWHRLPLPALDAALERYFADHHNPGLPYHQLPHFRVLLVASGLAGAARGGARGAGRARCVSQWARALAAPALSARLADHARHLLRVLTDLAPFVEPEELTELLSRALIMLCVQPADAIAMPVWEQWVRACDARVRRACASAVGSLTAIDSFATLGDTLVKAIMNEKEPAEWSEVWSRWAAGCAWGAAALVSRARPHAAYAALLARAHPPAELRDALRALRAADIDFVENEVILSVWICVATRVSCGAAEGDECASAARALLASWAERRRTLLQLVTMHPAGNWPTPQQQLLCRLSLHVSSPSDATWRACEVARSACGAGVPRATFAPCTARAVPSLALTLYPARQHYFAEELRRADPASIED